MDIPIVTLHRFVYKLYKIKFIRYFSKSHVNVIVVLGDA